MNGQIHHSDPKHPLQFFAAGLRDCWTDRSHPPASMYIIESLHPDGWREQGSARVEYWGWRPREWCKSPGTPTPA